MHAGQYIVCSVLYMYLHSAVGSDALHPRVRLGKVGTPVLLHVAPSIAADVSAIRLVGKTEGSSRAEAGKAHVRIHDKPLDKRPHVGSMILHCAVKVAEKANIEPRLPQQEVYISRSQSKPLALQTLHCLLCV